MKNKYYFFKELLIPKIMPLDFQGSLDLNLDDTGVIQESISSQRPDEIICMAIPAYFLCTFVCVDAVTLNSPTQSTTH